MRVIEPVSDVGAAPGVEHGGIVDVFPGELRARLDQIRRQHMPIVPRQRGQVWRHDVVDGGVQEHAVLQGFKRLGL